MNFGRMISVEIKEKIRMYIEENLVVFEDEVVFKDEDNIFELGVVNSLFAMKLLNYIEKEFEIVIDNDELNISNFSSVNNIVNLIMKKRKGE